MLEYVRDFRAPGYGNPSRVLDDAVAS